MPDSTTRLGTGNITRLLWDFSLPAIVGMVVSSLYNIIDRIFIGHAIGSMGAADEQPDTGTPTPSGYRPESLNVLFGGRTS